MCLARPRTCSCLSCRLCDLCSQLRMQADKCRTSSRSVKKELVIESPLRCKDAAQGEGEAESPGPVLVRGAGPRGFCCLPHTALSSPVRAPCLLALRLDSKLACLWRALFSVSSFRFDLGSTLILLWEERYVDILWVNVVSKRLLCIYNSYILFKIKSHLLALLPV